MSAPVLCELCGRAHDPGIVAAVGRFQPGGPHGYVAVGVEGAPVRSTRAEAAADWCRAGQGRAVEDLQPG